MQESDLSEETAFEVVSDREPTASELADLRTAWLVGKHVKSNAITLVRDGVLVGMGAGQPNRVESARLAVGGAGDHFRRLRRRNRTPAAPSRRRRRTTARSRPSCPGTTPACWRRWMRRAWRT